MLLHVSKQSPSAVNSEESEAQCLQDRTFLYIKKKASFYNSGGTLTGGTHSFGRGQYTVNLYVSFRLFKHVLI